MTPGHGFQRDALQPFSYPEHEGSLDWTRSGSCPSPARQRCDYYSLKMGAPQSNAANQAEFSGYVRPGKGVDANRVGTSINRSAPAVTGEEAPHKFPCTSRHLG
jgi:hypothetical protein